MSTGKIKYLVLSIASVCLLTACSKNLIKEGTEQLEQGDYEKAVTAFEQAAEDAEKELDRAP